MGMGMDMGMGMEPVWAGYGQAPKWPNRRGLSIAERIQQQLTDVRESA